jgi:hypothetical protein
VAVLPPSSTVVRNFMDEYGIFQGWSCLDGTWHTLVRTETWRTSAPRTR